MLRQRRLKFIVHYGSFTALELDDRVKLVR